MLAVSDDLSQIAIHHDCLLKVWLDYLIVQEIMFLEYWRFPGWQESSRSSQELDVCTKNKPVKTEYILKWQ